MTTDAAVLRGAVLSDCGRYRYELLRQWDPSGPVATFVMLNPSTADAEIDDPTIRRCVGFARAWGMSALRVLNVYAYRATDPRDLWRTADPVGPENDAHLSRFAVRAARNGWPLVAAWGAHAKPSRVAWVRELPGFDHLTCLGRTKDGAPRHPLYLRSDSPLVPFGATP